MPAYYYEKHLPDVSDATVVLGTCKPVNETGERCPSCNGRELVDRIDAIGRVSLRCTTCGWREDVRSGRTPPPEPPVVTTRMDETVLAAWRNGQSASKANFPARVRAWAEAVPHEWTALAVIVRETRQPATTTLGMLKRAMTDGLVQRDYREVVVTQGKGAQVRRKVLVVRRVAA